MAASMVASQAFINTPKSFPDTDISYQPRINLDLSEYFTVDKPSYITYKVDQNAMDYADISGPINDLG